MDRPNPLEFLHLRYAQLARRDPSRIDAEQRRSLRYYRAELCLMGAMSEPEGLSKLVVRWVQNLLNLERFVALEGRWPRENNRLPKSCISAEERRLASWVRTERKLSTIERRSSYQLARLACLAGHTWHPLDDRWLFRLGEYRDFIETHGSAPKVRSADLTESGLARWASKQRHFYRSGRLSQERVRSLQRLSIWTWGAQTKATHPARTRDELATCSGVAERRASKELGPSSARTDSRQKLP
jgi:hypothetical protein